jgi:hypothetical protein
MTKEKNVHAAALGRLGGKASPRKDAWRAMTDEERTANGKAAASARWGAMTEDQRKEQMERVRAGRKSTKGQE